MLIVSRTPPPGTPITRLMPSFVKDKLKKNTPPSFVRYHILKPVRSITAENANLEKKTSR